MTEEERIDDPIARALLGDSAYARQKVLRAGLFSQSPATKLRWQGYLLFALALVAPAALSLPEAVKAAVLGGDPLAASPTALLLGVAALVVHLGTATVHAFAAAVDWRFEDALSERGVELVVAVEEFASVLGLGLGGIFVVATNAYVLVGHAGLDGLRAFSQAGTAGPLASSAAGPSVLQLAVVAVGIGFATVVLARSLETRARADRTELSGRQ
jgi:hypothetical protein